MNAMLWKNRKPAIKIILDATAASNPPGAPRIKR
jgi:hypothetical protein